ncbi:MAG: aminoglycoside phosphotransferase family protein [candidate division WOR-3 bacterium]|nr:MAG: aminoglycoside phosphotransferase family protein [candidate division WOR-3 bacterium]
MTNDQPAWPIEHIALDAASRWVASACACEVDTPEILRTKRWGVTARFGSVVLKASFTPLFPQVIDVHDLLEKIVPEGAPRLIASEMVNGQLWTLFEHLQGATAEEIGTPGALEATARELARVQAAVAKLDLTRLPVLDVRRVPGILLEDDLSDLPVELVQWLRDAQPALQLDADALADIPPSFDHPDVNGSNAIILDDGRAILIDWEEATVGCPLFSLDRLLSDAHELSAVETVTEAYLDTLRMGGLEQVERAMRLVPLKLAHESRAYARALGWPHPHTRLTTLLLELAQRRSMDGPLNTWLSDLLAS